MAQRRMSDVTVLPAFRSSLKAPQENGLIPPKKINKKSVKQKDPDSLRRS